jgi:hypothetical protein
VLSRHSSFGLGVVAASCVSFAGACGGADAGVASCFSPSVQDPSFVSSSDWTAAGGAAIGLGAVTFDVPAMCAHAGIAQTLHMPPVGCAPPPVLSVDAALGDDAGLNLFVGTGAGQTSSVLVLGTQTLKVCLGASALGGEVPFSLGVGNNPGLCAGSGAVGTESPGGGPALTIARVSIDADLEGRCPLPGTLPDGDFEGGAASWKLASGLGTADVAPGMGEGGSSAAHIATDEPCEVPKISTTISVPTPAMVPNPALRVWSQGTSGAIASVRVGSQLPVYSTGATYLAGTGAPAVVNVCLPRWTQGTVQPLGFAFVATTLAQQCATPSARDFLFDGLRFVSDPACAANADLFDPGFEQVVTAPGVAPFWSIDRYDDEAGVADVRLVADAGAAHTGKVAAVFSASTPCSHATLSGSVTVPSAGAGGGPALKLWWKSATEHMGLQVSMSALAPKRVLAPASGWTQLTACLDPRLAGRPDLLSLALVSVDGGGTCDDLFLMETATVDDLELTTDPSCAAK